MVLRSDYASIKRVARPVLKGENNNGPVALNFPDRHCINEDGRNDRALDHGADVAVTASNPPVVWGRR